MNELQVKEDKHCIADFAYGGSDASYIWHEPKEDQASALYLDANFEKSFKIDDVSSVFHYELIAKDGGLTTYMSGGGKGEIGCSEFNQMLHEVELTDLPLAVSIPHASEDNFLDVDFAKVPDLDCEFYDELSGANLRSEIHSPVTTNDEVGVSESSIIEPRCFTDEFRKLTAEEIHVDSGSKCRYERPVEDSRGFKCSLSSDAKDISKTNIVHSTQEIECSLSHGENTTQFSVNSVKEPCTFMNTEDEVGSESQCTEVNNFCMDELSTDSCAEINVISSRQRRLCRPPQRYLDGSSWLNAKLYTEKKQGTSLSRKENMDLGVRSQKKRGRKRLERRASTTTTRNREFDSDEEYDSGDSCFNARKSKRGDRRKYGKAWKLDEVVTLVDGMSKFGTGQWTAVKNAFFSSSRRTTTDIRDKWRNLVKTHCKSSSSRQDDQNTRKGKQQLPESLIEQVREIMNAPNSSSKRGRRFSNQR